MPVQNMGEMHPEMPRPLAEFERREALRVEEEKAAQEAEPALEDAYTPPEYAEGNPPESAEEPPA